MNFDIYLFHFLNDTAARSHYIADVAVFFAYYVPYLVIIAALSLLFLKRASLKAKIRFALVASLSVIIANSLLIPLIRIFIERPRPFIVLPSIQLLHESSYSFPSGHATAFFAIGMSVYFFNKKLGVIFLLSAALISIARIMVGIHYPSDVVAGAFLGAFVSFAFYKLFNFLLPV